MKQVVSFVNIRAHLERAVALFTHRIMYVCVLITCGLAPLITWSAERPESTNRPYSSFVTKNVMIPMRDGARLAADIYAPSVNGLEAAPGRFPILLARTPYGKENLGGVQESMGAVSILDPSGANSRGYIVVLQDARGTFNSEGAFSPMQNEGHDGYDTVQWLIKQPWSDGRVGTFGPSYLGGTQMLLAAEAPAGLVASFSQVAATDQFRNEWVYMDGVFTLFTAAPWTAFMMDDFVSRRSKTDQVSLLADYAAIGIKDAKEMRAAYLSRGEKRDVFAKLLETLPLRDMPVVRQAPWWEAWLNNRDNPKYFQNNAMSSRFENIKVPILHVGGWYDLFLRNTCEHFKGISNHAKDHAVRSQQRLLIGPWSHGSCTSCPANANLNGQTLQLAWMDQWFKDKKNAFFDQPVVLYVMGEDRWRAEDSWPLTGTRPIRYYLHSQGHANTASGDGTLSTSTPVNDPPDRYAYDPRDPAPTLGGISVAGGRALQNVVEARADVLVFTSAELTQDVEVTGEVSAVLYAASSARDTDWWVKLIDVAPDGKAYILNHGVVRARYRHSRTEPRPLIPGKIERYRIDLWATSNVFRKGHRMRVEVTSSNFPLAERHPNAFVNLSTATEKDFVVATQTVYHDAEHPSYVELPIIPQNRQRMWLENPFPHAKSVEHTEE